MKIATWIVLAFGILVLIGGLIGHFKAGSNASLIAGGITGAALLVCALAMNNGYEAGRYVALGLAIALMTFFHYRYVCTSAFMPAGLMAVTSCLVAILLYVFRPKGSAV